MTDADYSHTLPEKPTATAGDTTAIGQALNLAWGAARGQCEKGVESARWIETVERADEQFRVLRKAIQLRDEARDAEDAIRAEREELRADVDALVEIQGRISELIGKPGRVTDLVRDVIRERDELRAALTAYDKTLHTYWASTDYEGTHDPVEDVDAEADWLRFEAACDAARAALTNHQEPT